MVTYLVTFAVILLVLYGAVRVHMFLGFDSLSKREEISHSPHLHDVLFNN